MGKSKGWWHLAHAHARDACAEQLILHITAPTTRLDVLFRLCLAFPENTNFIIDLCSFVIFITWPALLLKAMTNSTSPGLEGARAFNSFRMGSANSLPTHGAPTETPVVPRGAGRTELRSR